MKIVLSDAARDKLAEAGFDPVYGARPLKRAIQQQVENPLAQEILQGKFKPGRRDRGHGVDRRSPRVPERGLITYNHAGSPRRAR